MPLSEEALYACYLRMEKPLYNVLFRWLWQPQECQDVIHDAFLRVWDRREAIDLARLDALVWTTALNLARNRLCWRKLRVFAQTSEDTASELERLEADRLEPDPLEAAARAQRDAHLRKALDTLPTPMRRVLLLSEFGGLGVAEVAQLLGIPAGTVASRKHAAVARLRVQLKEFDNE